MLNTKLCSSCHATKPFSEFHRDRAGRHGVASRCKPCAIAAAIAHTLAKRETPDGRKRLREIELACRERNRLKDRECAARYRTEHPDRVKASQSRVDPFKRRARGILRMAVYDGRIIKPGACSECGWSGRVHGHHEDYSKPLSVIWLCAICHGLRHRKDRSASS